MPHARTRGIRERPPVQYPSAGVVERVNRNPVLKSRLGAYYFGQSAVATFLRRYTLRPPKL